MSPFPPKPSSEQALDILRAGNARFVAGKSNMPRFDAEYRKMLVKGKRSDHVFATVLGCADSRVTPEFVFNSNPGDLFVIRTAGFACLSEESLASVEFGAIQLESAVLVVLGHTDCKAVRIAFEKTDLDAPETTPCQKRTFSKLAESLDADTEKPVPQKETETGDPLDEVVKRNVFLTIERIRGASPEIRKLEEAKKLIIAPALYRLEDGVVEWLA